ncbi:MAG TPA: hypothetical protein VKW78_09640 [Terriglobales bacterium]|jgi:hypothetical protein|nr:hypothetical protein [Terriglobales bacterium]
MIGSTKIWTTIHRGIEVRFWQTGQHWFAVAPGQERELQGHSTLRAALQCAFDFINDDRRMPVLLPSIAATPKDEPQAQPVCATSPEQPFLLQAAAS